MLSTVFDLDVKHGLRQGSICGPLFFIVVTHSLPFDLSGDLVYRNEDGSMRCDGGSMCYADDTNNDRSAKNAESVVTGLNASAQALTEASGRLELALNPSKTQLLYAGPKFLTSAAEALPLNVNGAPIKSQKEIEILGFTLDAKLSPEPYLTKLKTALQCAKGLAIRTRPLLLPHIHRALVCSLVNGKVGSYAASALSVRLPPSRLDPNDQKSPASASGSAIQIVINDIARALLGKRRAEKISVRALLDKSGLRSFNETAFSSAALLAWHAMNSTTHPLHKALSMQQPDSRLRAASDGKLLSLSPKEAKVAIAANNAIKIWNAFPELRLAKSVHSAKTMVKSLSRELPI